MEQETIETRDEVVKRLLRKIIMLEKRNLKTKEYGYAQIVKKIMAMIEEEVECY